MSKFPESEDFLILPLEKTSEERINLTDIHCRRGNEFFFISSGYMIRRCNFNDIRLNSKDIHISLSRQATSVVEFSPDITGYYCCFSNAFMEQVYLKESIENDLEFINSFLFQYPLRLDERTYRQIDYLFHTLLNLDCRYDADKALIQAYIVASVYEIKKLMIESGLDFYPSKAFLITKKYNDLLATHIKTQRSLEFYAKALDITPNHLNKSVKAVTGRTAITLLNEISLQEAKMQLKYTSLPVNEIASILGFEDLSYFSRFFKKSTGSSPLKYRKGGA